MSRHAAVALVIGDVDFDLRIGRVMNFSDFWRFGDDKLYSPPLISALGPIVSNMEMGKENSPIVDSASDPTLFSNETWIQSTKPKTMFLTKGSRKFAWGDTRSITDKFRIFDTFELA